MCPFYSQVTLIFNSEWDHCLAFSNQIAAGTTLTMSDSLITPSSWVINAKRTCEHLNFRAIYATDFQPNLVEVSLLIRDHLSLGIKRSRTHSSGIIQTVAHWYGTFHFSRVWMKYSTKGLLAPSFLKIIRKQPENRKVFSVKKKLVYHGLLLFHFVCLPSVNFHHTLSR